MGAELINKYIERIKVDYPEDDKLMIDLQGFLKEADNYWKTRCELAEKYIDKSPCDPDIYDDQLEAYRKWVEFKIKDQ